MFKYWWSAGEFRVLGVQQKQCKKILKEYWIDFPIFSDSPKPVGETLNVRIPSPGNQFTLSEVWTSSTQDTHDSTTWRDKVVEESCPVDDSTTLIQHDETGKSTVRNLREFI